MKLSVEKRSDLKKSVTKKLRKTGFVPAVVYGEGKNAEHITVDGGEFQKGLNKLPKGSLPTTVFTLEEGGASFTAVLKDIQYHIITYDIIHLDFEKLSDQVKVRVRVPIRCIGDVKSPGVKQGGILRSVIRNLRVECFPKDIPSEFIIDVSDLGMKQAKKLSAIELPKGVRALADLNEVAATIAKR